jgi:hypothetical protein
MQNKNQAIRLGQEWDDAIERAQQATTREQPLGDMLTESAGLHIKSGVEAGGLWGTTSCTCQQTCTQNAICSS